MSIDGKWGILKQIPVSAGYNDMKYSQNVLGMGYIGCSNQTLARIDLKIKGPCQTFIQFASDPHINIYHICYSVIFAKVTDEWAFIIFDFKADSIHHTE